MGQYTFKFIITGTSIVEDSLTLLSFTGQENISSLFDFEISLRCTDLQLNEDEILNQHCRLEIYYQVGTAQATAPLRVIQGMVNEFEDVAYYPDHTLYRARMVPRVWQLGLFETNEVYLAEPIADTLTTILEEANLIHNQDFRFELQREYRNWSFRLQYKETHLAYLQRIIEREGIYYYFESSDAGEVMVFCDHNQALPNIDARGEEKGALNYQVAGALNVSSKANTLTSIICKRQSLPKKVTLRDFNDETPSLDIRGEYEIDSKGMGEINLYGLNIISPEEGEELAKIHANAYICRHKSYAGESDVATLSAGHIFTIENHPRKIFNETPFIVESIFHEGTNLVEGERQAKTADHNNANYVNSFSALDANLKFAPQRHTTVPEIKGTLNAVIDAEADSGYAELDETGRYKVKLPFDRKNRDGGKASHWVRMMQPYGGKSEGMHFPLRKNTRVLLGFIGGDPDRPFISGTMGDSSEQASLVTAENQTNNVIQTSSGNRIEFEDKAGKQRLKLESPTNNTYVHLGAPNHDGSGYVLVTDGIERRDINGGQKVTIKTKPVGEALIPTPYNAASTYDIGDITLQANKTYECITAINSAEPFSELHWKEIEDNTTPEFDATADYNLGATVIHNGDTYRCIASINNITLFDAACWAKCSNISVYSPNGKYEKGQLVIHNSKTYVCLKSSVIPFSSAFIPNDWEELSTFEHTKNYSVKAYVKHEHDVYQCISAVSASKFDPDRWENLALDYCFYNKLVDGSGSTHLKYADEVAGGYIVRRTEGNLYTAHKGAQFECYPDLEFLVDANTSAKNKYPNNVLFSFGAKFEAHHIDPTSGFEDAFDLLIRTSPERRKNADSKQSKIDKGNSAQLTDNSLFEIEQGLLLSMRTTIEHFDQANVHIGRKIDIRQEGSESDVQYNYNSEGKLVYANTGDYEAKWNSAGKMIFESTNDETRTWTDKGKKASLEKNDGDYNETWEYDDNSTETKHTKVDGNITEEWVSSVGGSPASYTKTNEFGNNTDSYEAKYEPSSAHSASFSFQASHEASFSMTAGVSSSESVAISASASNAMSSSFNLGLSNEMSFELSGAASLKLAMEISGGPSIDIKNSIGLGGPSAEIVIEDGTVKKAEVSGFATTCRLSAMAAQFDADNAIKLRSESMKLLKETLELKSSELQVGSSKANLSNAIITLIS